MTIHTRARRQNSECLSTIQRSTKAMYL